jgi:hypothetical protein
MNTKCNVVKMVAAALLVVSTTAGAQILGGGGLGGTVNGALGGSFGAPGAQGTGSIAGEGAFGTGGIVDGTRGRVQQAGSRVRDTSTNAAANTRSRVESARGATDATAQAAHSASANVSRNTADAAQQGAAPAQGAESPATQPAGGLLLGGSGSASAEKKAMGRTISADGGGDSMLGVDRNGVQHSHNSRANVSAKKDQPAAAPAAEPAQ